MATQDNPHDAVVPLPEDIEWETTVEIIWGHASRQPHKLALVACSLDGTIKRLTFTLTASRTFAAKTVVSAFLIEKKTARCKRPERSRLGEIRFERVSKSCLRIEREVSFV